MESNLKYLDDILKHTSPRLLMLLLSEERKSTIALILSMIKSRNYVTKFLEILPEEDRVPITKAMFTIEPIKVKVMDIIYDYIKDLINQESNEVSFKTFEESVEVLRNIKKDHKRMIIEDLEVKAPELAEEIKDKLKLSFEKVFSLDDEDLYLLVEKVTIKDLGIAMQNMDKEKVSRIQSMTNKVHLKNFVNGLKNKIIKSFDKRIQKLCDTKYKDHFEQFTEEIYKKYFLRAYTRGILLFVKRPKNIKVLVRKYYSHLKSGFSYYYNKKVYPHEIKQARQKIIDVLYNLEDVGSIIFENYKF